MPNRAQSIGLAKPDDSIAPEGQRGRQTDRMGTRILVVDDEPSMLKMLGMSLETVGYEITVAQDGQTALARALAARPELVILDVMMPGMDGLEVCRRLRQSPEMATVPIILLSAKGQVPDKVAGLKAGADEYVVKPIDMAELHARVAGLLERVSRLRAEQAPKAARIVSFIGAKGGVGTTTTTLNLGVAVALRGRRASAAELRAWPGSFGLLMAMSGTKGIEALMALEPRAITPPEVARYLAHHASGLDVLCAPAQITPDARLEAGQADAILDGMAAAAEIVLVDLPAYPTPAGQAAIQRSAVACLLVEPVRDCVEAGVEMARYVKSLCGAGTTLKALIVNRSAIAAPISPRDLQERLGLSVAGAIPPAADECARAQQLGRLVIQSQPEALVSQAFKSLAETLLMGAGN